MSALAISSDSELAVMATFRCPALFCRKIFITFLEDVQGYVNTYCPPFQPYISGRRMTAFPLVCDVLDT